MRNQTYTNVGKNNNLKTLNAAVLKGNGNKAHPMSSILQACVSLLRLPESYLREATCTKIQDTLFSYSKQLTEQIHKNKIKQNLAWIHFDDCIFNGLCLGRSLNL